MAGQTVEIILKARDGSSQVFRTVGREAQTMGRQIDSSAKTSEQSLSRLSKAGAAAGAIFTTLSGTLTIAARANAEAEASQARLETAIENTGHSAFEYEAALKAASKAALQLGFDDEDAADSIAKLTTAMGDAGRAIDALSIAEDIARARKIDLAAATQIVIAAEQGRNGALARVGIAIDENATKEQALDALRRQFAGNAEAYAETSAAGYDRLKNSAENALEAIGSHLGPAQELLMVLPGLSAGFTGVGAAVGTLAPNLTKASAAAALFNVALGPVGLAALAIGAGVALYTLASTAKDDVVPSIDLATDSANALNQTLESLIRTSSQTAPLAKAVTEDFEFIGNAVQDYQARLAAATAEAKKFEFIPSGAPDVVAEYTAHQQHAAQALKELEAEQAKGRISTEELAAAQQAANDILMQSGPAGDLARDTLQRLHEAQKNGTLVTKEGESQWEAYLRQVTELGAQLPTFVTNMEQAETQTKATGDAASATAVEVDKLGSAQNEAAETARAHATAALAQHDAMRGVADMLTSQTKALAELNREQAAGALADTIVGPVVDPSNIVAATAALKEQEGAYYRVRDGVISLSDAQAIAHQTQRDLLASQEPYNQQLSTYNTQLGNIEAAVEVLNERKARGVQLTQEEIAFLDGAAAGQQRLAGGVEDATIALGMQALQYAENMKIGDALNENMAGQVEATKDLDNTIRELILALDGIPAETRAEIILLDNEAEARARRVKDQLDALDGYYANATISVGLVGPGVGYTPGFEHGGMLPHAQHGRMAPDGWFWVGEAGPELMNRNMVTPHTASVENTKRSGGGAGLVIQNLNVYANSPREFMEQMRHVAYAQRIG